MFRTKFGLTNSLGAVYDDYFSGKRLLKASNGIMLNEVRNSGVSTDYPAQQALRAMFGKAGTSVPSIGDHPDFLHLKGTELQEYCAVTTMFMDLESSTRLGLLYAPQDVFRIKNAFISIAIEIIKAFDGHVHRIMGDAVMAYFGGRNEKPSDSAVNALNCAAVLNMFVETVVVPKLQNEGFDRDFGIRIGLDHGSKEKVLWAAYGLSGMEEVTATSYYVDVASKLQHSAGRNQIMVGDSLKSLLELPDELVEKKVVMRDGISTEEPVLKPNLTDHAGKPINYKQFVFRWEEYLSFSPLASLDQTTAVQVAVSVHDAKDGPASTMYRSVSSSVPKNKWLKFAVTVPFIPRLPYRVRFSVENHGEDAFNANGSGRGDHYTDIIVNNQAEHGKIKHWEYTQYRGLQYMIVEIFGSSGKVGGAKMGIYID